MNGGPPYYGVVTSQPQCFAMEMRPRAVLLWDVPISCKEFGREIVGRVVEGKFILIRSRGEETPTSQEIWLLEHTACRYVFVETECSTFWLLSGGLIHIKGSCPVAVVMKPCIDSVFVGTLDVPIILIWISKWDGVVWTGLLKLRIGTGGRHS